MCRTRFGRVPHAGASVSIEVKMSTPSVWNLLELHTLGFMEASQRRDPSLTPFSALFPQRMGMALKIASF